MFVLTKTLMMDNVIFQYNPWWDTPISKSNDFKREKPLAKLIEQLKNNQIVLVTGIRRVGKTTLLKQVIEELILKNKVSSKNILYVSLDHYLLLKHNILEIVERFMQINQIQLSDRMYLFFDEVTSQPDFEIQLKNIYDLYNAKVYISSSSASLLKSKKPYLTGRSAIHEILPLDFSEYLVFKQIKLSKADNHLLSEYFHQFLTTGGIPEFVLRNDISYLSELVDDIIYKDIAAQHGIRRPEILREYFLLLMERSGKQLSINKIASILKISPDTARRYLEMFADVFLIHLVKRPGKTNDTILSPQKIYAADLGIRTNFIGKRDYGSLFENYVYLKIKHLNPKYLYKEGIELDFFTENKILLEAKYHDEALSEKQEKLFNATDAEKKIIIRKYSDLDEF